jgi:hypothetical protein
MQRVVRATPLRNRMLAGGSGMTFAIPVNEPFGPEDMLRIEGLSGVEFAYQFGNGASDPRKIMGLVVPSSRDQRPAAMSDPSRRKYL